MRDSVKFRHRRNKLNFFTQFPASYWEEVGAGGLCETSLLVPCVFDTTLFDTTLFDITLFDITRFEDRLSKRFDASTVFVKSVAQVIHSLCAEAFPRGERL